VAGYRVGCKSELLRKVKAELPAAMQAMIDAGEKPRTVVLRARLGCSNNVIYRAIDLLRAENRWHHDFPRRNRCLFRGNEARPTNPVAKSKPRPGRYAPFVADLRAWRKQYIKHALRFGVVDI